MLVENNLISKDEETVQYSEGPMGEIAIDDGDAEDEAMRMHAYCCDDDDDSGGYVGDDGNPYYSISGGRF